MAQYVRVYYSVVDDDRFRDVYDTPHLATWLRLLMIADAIWPASAYVPASEEPESIAVLVASGLVELSGKRFRIHGLDSERNARGSAARTSASARWHSVRNANAELTHDKGIAAPNAEPMLNRAEQEQSRAEHPAPAREGLPHLDTTVAGIWETATGRTVLASGQYASGYLDDACRRHPPSEVGAAVLRARKSFNGSIPDAAQMVSAMRPLLDPLPDRNAVRAVESEDERRAASRRRVQATKAGIHGQGFHDDAPDAACDMCASVTS